MTSNQSKNNSKSKAKLINKIEKESTKLNSPLTSRNDGTKVSAEKYSKFLIKSKISKNFKKPKNNTNVPSINKSHTKNYLSQVVNNNGNNSSFIKKNLKSNLNTITNKIAKINNHSRIKSSYIKININKVVNKINGGKKNERYLGEINNKRKQSRPITTNNSIYNESRNQKSLTKRRENKYNNNKDKTLYNNSGSISFKNIFSLKSLRKIKSIKKAEFTKNYIIKNGLENSKNISNNCIAQTSRVLKSSHIKINSMKNLLNNNKDINLSTNRSNNKEKEKILVKLKNNNYNDKFKSQKNIKEFVFYKKINKS